MSERDYIIAKALRGPVNIHRVGLGEKLFGPTKRVQQARNAAYTANRQAVRRAEQATRPPVAAGAPTLRDYQISHLVRGSGNYRSGLR